MIAFCQQLAARIVGLTKDRCTISIHQKSQRPIGISAEFPTPLVLPVPEARAGHENITGTTMLPITIVVAVVECPHLLHLAVPVVSDEVDSFALAALGCLQCVAPGSSVAATEPNDNTGTPLNRMSTCSSFDLDHVRSYTNELFM